MKDETHRKLVSLDALDRQLLALLSENATATNASLAETVGLSTSACSERLRRLRDAQVLAPPRAAISPEALGIGISAIVAIQLTKHTRASVDAFRNHVDGIPEVVSVWHVSGDDDFIMKVVARDMNHLRDLTLDEFTKIPEVARLRSSMIFNQHEKSALPDLTKSALPDPTS